MAYYQFNTGIKSWKFFAKQITSIMNDNLELKSDNEIHLIANEIFNEGDTFVSGTLGVSGNIIGNVIGNASTSEIVTNSTQSNITSLGTLDYVSLSGDSIINMNGDFLQVYSSQGLLFRTGSENNESFVTLEPNSFGGNLEYQSSSDQRLKFNEQDISNSLNLIRQLTPKKYDKSSKLNEEINTTMEAGLIAQDILLINDLSWCVKGNVSNSNVQDHYSLLYNSLSMYHLSATKELDIIVQRQLNEIESLKAENTIMKAALNELLSSAGKNCI